ncbi:hypothetical protein ACEPAF_4028 [Sanghuangporus sanghuang]
MGYLRRRSSPLWCRCFTDAVTLAVAVAPLRPLQASGPPQPIRHSLVLALRAYRTSLTISALLCSSLSSSTSYTYIGFASFFFLPFFHSFLIMAKSLVSESASASSPSGTAVQPVPAVTPDTGVTNPDTCQSPTSPPLPQPSQLDAKDRRAYEVARQRAKRPEDRRKARNQKEAKHGWLAGVTGRGARAAQEKDAREATVVNARDLKKEVTVLESQSKPDAVGVTGLDAHEARITVRLEDLIRVAKVRKEKADDFEVVPHVRAVIALDETDFACDTEGAKIPTPNLDFDDWEHVASSSDTSSSEDDEPRKAPSYAQVVSNKQQ